MKTSSCVFGFDTADLLDQRLLDAPGRTHAGHHVMDVGAADAEVLRYPRTHPAIFQDSQKCFSRAFGLGIVTSEIVNCHDRWNIPSGIFRVKKKMNAPKTAGPRPEWARRIESFRQALGLKQVPFASALRVTQGAVSRWESGKREPDSRTYIELASFAWTRDADDDRRYFLDRAGIDPTEIALGDQRVPVAWQPITTITIVPGRGAAKPDDLYAFKKKPEAVGLALLKGAGALGSPRQINEAAVERTIVADARDCPHPERTVCIRVVGDSMQPVLEEGYIVAIDTKDNIPEELVGKMVAAGDAEGGVTIKWLRQSSGELMLVAQHTSQRFPPILLKREPGWRILGRVIWWIGTPQ